MPPIRRPYHSLLFTLRLWQEETAGESYEWRGQLQNTTTGEVRYFREGGRLVHLLWAMLAEEEAAGAHDEPPVSP